MASWTTVRSRLASLFGCDLRSLAALRIALGLSLLFVLASYAGVYGDLFAIDGVLSIASLRANLPGAAVWPLAFFELAPGIFEWLLLVLLATVACCLVLGWHTRLACVAAWFAVVCLIVRNPSTSDYGDELLARVLFWSCFLPLGARWSLDARRPGAVRHAGDSVLSVASAALLIQIASVYLVGGFAKSGAEWRDDLSAIERVVGARYWATPLSTFPLGFPGLMRLATRITPTFEIAIALVLFSPVANARARTLAVALLIGFHATLASFIIIGVAPLISIGVLPAFLPGAFWDRLATRLSPRFAREPAPATPASYPRPALGAARELLVAVPALMLLLQDVAEISRARGLVPQPVRAVAMSLRLTQEWQMYSTIDRFDGWYMAPGLLANGRPVDLMRGGEIPLSGPPERLPWAGDSYRVGVYRDELRANLAVLGRDYGRWLCRSWNRHHSPEERLLELEVVWMSIDRALGASPEPKRIALVRRRCDPKKDDVG
jgi:hypothetical protein